MQSYSSNVYQTPSQIALCQVKLHQSAPCFDDQSSFDIISPECDERVVPRSSSFSLESDAMYQDPSQIVSFTRQRSGQAAQRRGGISVPKDPLQVKADCCDTQSVVAEKKGRKVMPLPCSFNRKIRFSSIMSHLKLTQSAGRTIFSR